MNTVEQIYDSLTDIAETTLGVSWKRLRKVLNPEQNDFRNIEKGYGFRHGAASPDADATKVFVLAQEFELVLAHRAAARDQDGDVQERAHILYDNADEVFKECVRSKLNLPFVTHVDGLGFSEPLVTENGAVVLVASLTVRYFIDPY